MKRFIEELLKTREEIYLRDPTLIVQDYNSEKKMVDEYDGRQLLEMLQNANDACITDNEKVCYIELTEKTLIIANNGKGFDEGGIRALMYIDLSDKQDDDNTIGKKGLGFRSILNWAKSVIVKSNGFALEFSKENAIGFLNNLIKKKPSISEDIHSLSKKEQYPIASLRCPKLIDVQGKYDKYDTYIILNLEDDFDISVVEDQIENELNLEVLLFLNHLTTIIVNSPSHKFRLSKTEDSNESSVKIVRSNLETNEVIEQNLWTVLSENGAIEDRFYELKIAWDDDLRNPIGFLYSYFKTEVFFNFPCLVHGTFELTANRNHFLNGSSYNKALAGKLADLLIKAALSIAKNEVSYKPLKMLLIKDNEVDYYFKNLGFFDLLSDKIKKSTILPTIGNKYVSIYRNPCMLSSHNYAKILPAESFADLLQYTSDKTMVEFVKEMGVDEYDRELLFTKLSEISSSFSMSERESLIKFIYSDYSRQLSNDSEWQKLPSLLVDEKESVISADKEKFRKPDISHSLPLDSDISFVHPLLIKNLGVDCIKWFGVKPYSFGVAYNIIHKKYISGIKDPNKDIESKKTIIKEHLALLNQLYMSDEKSDLEQALRTRDVYVVNRNGKIIIAKKAYFGKDYDCDLCETLFHYNQDYFLDNPKSLCVGLEDEYGFFSFLGVANEPRRFMKKAENDYLEFALRHYPYDKKKLYNKYSSYDEVKVKNYSFYDNSVESIQDLEDILLKNSNESILLWLFQSNFSQTEMNNDSHIRIDFSSLRYWCDIGYREMPSYILWKIGQISWLKTESGNKTTPSKCCSSKTLTKAFSPLIEIPKINYGSIVFKENGVSKTNIDSVLQDIGVKTRISDIDYKTIYSILRNLRKIDPQGEIASSIYQQLASNYDVKMINRNDWQNCGSFMYDGYVFCKLGQIGKYCVTRDAVYISQYRNIPEDILNHFWMIDIPRRYSESSISKLFGIETVSEINFSVESFQEIAKNNEILQKIERAKPLFYAFKVEKDEDNKYLQSIKDLKITFCKEIRASFQYQESSTEYFTLATYEYVCYNNQYYVCSDDEDDFGSLEISNTISKIVAERIGDSSQTLQKQFRSIFFHLDNERNIELLFKEAGFGWESIAMAKERMNISDDPKTIFWMDVLSTLGDKTSYYQKITEQQLANKVKSKTGVSIADFPINYKDLKDEGNIECLSSMFDKMGINATDFNHHSSTKVNFRTYYKRRLQNLRKDKENAFASLHYQRLKDETEERQGAFLSDLNDYKSFDFDIPEVIADIDAFFYATVKEAFGVDLRMEANPISVNDIFKEQKRLLMQTIQEMPSPNKELLENIISTDVRRSLICFGRFDGIIKEYEEKNIPIVYNQNGANGDSGKSNDVIREMAQSKQFRESTEQIRRKDISNSKNKPKGTSVRGKGTVEKSVQEKNTPRKSEIDDIGKMGELMAVDYLIQQYGKDNVLWESRYAQELGENVQGSDNNHYDIRYKNSNGEWTYVEVKSSKNDVTEFSLTKAETEFGIENRDRYELFHITNIDSDNPTKRVFKPFDSDNFLESKEFTVIPNGYVFKYKVEGNGETGDEENNES